MKISPFLAICKSAFGAAALLGTLGLGATVASAADFVVTNTADSGAGSLRQAILDAEGNDNGTTLDTTDTTDTTLDTISFGPTFDSQQQITLTTGQFVIASKIQINGPAAQVIIITRNASRAFQVSSGAELVLERVNLVGAATGQVQQSGGAILNSGLVTLRNSSLQQHATLFGGGAIFNAATGRFFAFNTVFNSNRAPNGDGAGISNAAGGRVELTDCVVSASVASGQGGGVRNLGTLTVLRSSLNGNSASQGGSGLSTDGTATLTNTTLTTTLGGGVLNRGTLRVESSTLSINGSGNQNAIASLAGTVTINNSIAVTAKNTNPNTSFNPGGSNNILSGTPAQAGLESDANGFAVAKNNGGATPTVALLGFGPATDAGSNALIPTGVTTDQRGAGFARIVGANVDIGAFESPSLPPRVQSIRCADVNPTQSSSVSFTVTFTVTFSVSVTGVGMDDFAVVTSEGIIGASVTSVTGSGTTYTVTVSGINGTSGTVGLNLVDDDTIIDALGNHLGGTGTANGNFTGPVYIRNEMPSLSINSPSIVEGNRGTKSLALTLTLSSPSEQAVSVNFATAEGSAKAGSDYQSKTGTLTFAPGETSRIINIPIVGDLIDESNETLKLNLSNGVGATLSASSATGTITDDDGQPSISVNDVKVAEANTVSVNAHFIVKLSNPSSRTVKVNFTTFYDTASAPTDYNAYSGTLSFAPGETSKTLTVVVRGDSRDESDETFKMRLSSPVNASISDATGVGTILDNDPTPSISVGDVSVTEADTSSVNAIFNVRLSSPSGRTVRVNFTTFPGTTRAPIDYNAFSGTLSFAPGEASKNLTVVVKGDLLDESNENFEMRLSSPVNASISDATGVGTILDNDPAPSLSIGDVSLLEGNSGTKAAVFVVSLGAPSGREVKLNFITVGGSAVGDSDYERQSGSLTLAPGQTSKAISVAIFGDTVFESNESFQVTLSGAINAGIAKASGTSTIQNDDVFVPPTPSGAGKIVFTSRREHPVTNFLAPDIYIMNADGTSQTRLTFTSCDFSPTFSPDGTKIAWMSHRDLEQIYVMGTDGTNPTLLSNGTARDYSPAYSPDGHKIVFASGSIESGSFGISAIWVMNADGTGRTRLTTGDGIYSTPRFSPDGHKIVFELRAGFSDYTRVWMMNSDGSGQIPVTTFASDNHPSFSPDGQTLLFASGRYGASGVYSIKPDGTNQKYLSFSGNSADRSPCYSPDGQKIAFYRVDGGEGIYTMNADGSGKIRIPGTGYWDDEPSWARGSVPSARKAAAPGPPPSSPSGHSS